MKIRTFLVQVGKSRTMFAVQVLIINSMYIDIDIIWHLFYVPGLRRRGDIEMSTMFFCANIGNIKNNVWMVNVLEYYNIFIYIINIQAYSFLLHAPSVRQS